MWHAPVAAYIGITYMYIRMALALVRCWEFRRVEKFGESTLDWFLLSGVLAGYVYNRNFARTVVLVVLRVVIVEQRCRIG